MANLMDTYTINVPKQLKADVLAAAKRSSDRREAAQRNPLPFTFTEADVLNLVSQFLMGIIQTDAQEAARQSETASLAAAQQTVTQQMRDANL